MDGMTLGILFGLVSMIGFGLSNAISVVPIRKLGPVRTLFFTRILTTLLLLVSVLLFSDGFVFRWVYIPIAALIGFLGYLPILFFFKGLDVGKIGVISPVANSSVIFTVLLSMLFFDESLNMMQGMSIMLIIIGIIVVSVDFRHFWSSNIFQKSSGIYFAMMTCLLWGVLNFLLKIPVDIVGPFMTAMFIECAIFVYSFFHMKIRGEKIGIPDRRILIHILSVAAFVSVGSLFYLLGIDVAQVSIVAAISFANPAIAVMYGKLVYKEKLKKTQYLAVFLIILGIVLISYL